MAITWGPTVNYEGVGINVTMSPSRVRNGTSRVTLTVRYYVRTNRAFADNQTLVLSGSLGGSYNFYLNTPNGRIVNRLIATRTISVNTSFGGTVSRTFSARVTGQWSGGTPRHSRTFRVPRRPAVAPSRPGRPSISNITNNTARATWAAPSSNGGRAIGGYRWQIARNSSFSSGLNSGLQGTTRSRNMSNFAQGTTYYFRVRAYNSAANGSYSSSRAFTTHRVPYAPGRPTVSGVGQNEGRIAWNAPASGGSARTSYDVQLSTSSSFSSVSSWNQTTRNRRFTGLTPEVTYYARVRARNRYGAGPWSLSARITTFYEDLSVYPTPRPTVNPAASYSTGEPTIPVDIQEPHPFTGNETEHVSYELATNSGMTANRITGTFERRRSSSTIVNVPVNALPLQGTWFMRARRSGSRDLKMSAWSTVASFNVVHVPTARPSSPINGEFLAVATNRSFSLNVTDPWGNDNVSAYHLQIVENETNAPLVDTERVDFSEPRALGTFSITVPMTELVTDSELRWRVRVWDGTGVESAWSNWAVFTIVPLPVVNILLPEEDDTIETGMPTFEWAVDLTAGRFIESSTLIVTNDEDGEEVWRSSLGENITTITPPRPVLQNDTGYRLRIVSMDNHGLQGSATSNFYTLYPAPDPIEYNVTTEYVESEGYVLIDWTDSEYDDAIEWWEVYRKPMPSGRWELLATVENQSTPYYKDYLFQSGTPYMYTVVQLADRSGETLQSPLGYQYVGEDQEPEAEHRVLSPEITRYWIVVPEIPLLSTELPNVIDDASTLEVETEITHIIGRGRHIDYGDILGESGTLEIQIRQPEPTSTFRVLIEEIVKAQVLCYLRTPFGRLTPVGLGEPSWAPLAGTGNMEMGDLSLPYYEVR